MTMQEEVIRHQRHGGLPRFADCLRSRADPRGTRVHSYMSTGELGDEHKRMHGWVR